MCHWSFVALVAGSSLLLAVPASAQISLVDAKTATTAPASSVTVPALVGLSAGDVLVLAASQRENDSSAWVLPAGFHLLRSGATAEVNAQGWLLAYKVSTGAEGATVLGSQKLGGIVAAVVAYRGVDAADPIDVVEESVNRSLQGTPSPWLIAAPALTTTVSNTLLVWFGTADVGPSFGTLLIGSPSGFTQRAALVNTGATLALADQPFVGPGSPGAANGTLQDTGTAQANPASMMLALRPKGAPPKFEAIALVGQSYDAANASSTRPSLSLAVPTGTLAGDLLVLGGAVSNGSPATLTWPPGFVLATGTQTANYAFEIATKVATGTEATQTVTTTSVGFWSAVLLAYRGVDATNPIAAAIGTRASSPSTPPWAPAVTITPGTTFSRVLWFEFEDATSGFGGQTATPPLGFLERFDMCMDGTNLAVSDAQVSSAAQVTLTGAAFNSNGVSSTWGALALALRPADKVAPDTTVTSAPAARVASASAAITFTATEPATFACNVDQAGYLPCESPLRLFGLAQGAHSLLVRATDAAGNVDATPAQATWLVDTVAPETTITSAPPGTSALTTATFNFVASEPATFECSLDGALFSGCSSPRTYAALLKGGHSFLVRATDQAGNVDATPASVSWVISVGLDGGAGVDGGLDAGSAEGSDGGSNVGPSGTQPLTRVLRVGCGCTSSFEAHWLCVAVLGWLALRRQRSVT